MLLNSMYMMKLNQINHMQHTVKINVQNRHTRDDKIRDCEIRKSNKRKIEGLSSKNDTHFLTTAISNA